MPTAYTSVSVAACTAKADTGPVKSNSSHFSSIYSLSSGLSPHSSARRDSVFAEALPRISLKVLDQLSV